MLGASECRKSSSANAERRSRLSSSHSLWDSSARATSAISSSIWNGFFTNQNAPALIASTAVSTSPNAVIRITDTSDCRRLISRSSSMPLPSGSLKSRIARSGSSRSSSCRVSRTEPVVVTA